MKRFLLTALVCIMAAALFAGCGRKNSRAVFGAAGYEYGVAGYEYGVTGYEYGVTGYEYDLWGVTDYEYDVLGMNGSEYGSFATPEPDQRATRPSGDMYFIPGEGWVNVPGRAG